MNKNGFINIIIVGVVVIIIAAAGYFAMTQKTAEAPAIIQKSEVEDLPSEVLTKEDWKTYRNEEYGFEFKYPVQLLNLRRPGDDLLYKFKGSTGPGGRSIWSGGEDTIARLDLIFPEKDGTIAIESPKFALNLGVISGDTEKILDGWRTYLKKDYEIKNIKVSNLNATQIIQVLSEFKDKEPCLDGCFTVFTVVYKKPYNYIFSVGFSRIADDYMVKTYNQILSTFKFID